MEVLWGTGWLYLGSRFTRRLTQPQHTTTTFVAP